MDRQPRVGGGVTVPVPSVNDQRFRARCAMTGIGIKMVAPVRGPLSSIPVIFTITVLVWHNPVVPMVIDVDVVEADVIVMVMVVAMAVIVVMVVTPSPAVRPPPGLTPGSEPEAVAKSEAKADVPIVSEARAESIGAWTADPIASDIGRIVVARAVNYDVVWTDLSAEVAGSITGVHHSRG